MKFNKILIVLCFFAVCSGGIMLRAQSGSDTKKSSEEVSWIAWTFDCGDQTWNTYNHSMAFNYSHELMNDHVNSGHLELRNKEGNTESWLFGPLNDEIDADTYKYLHFSMSLENGGDLPEEGIEGLFVWDITNDGLINDLKTETFNFYSGDHEYLIDLSEHPDWKGIVNISRFHFPQGNQAHNNYTPATAVYRLDWVAVSNSRDFIIPVQDTTSACAPVLPVIAEEPEPVVFCNRASFKTSFAGSRSDATLKVWSGTDDTLVYSQTVQDEGDFYMSCFDLKLSTVYNYQIELENSVGHTVSSVHQFTTEDKTAEEMPVNYWMTPSPFDLEENASDDLLDDDRWPVAAEYAQVYKIHGGVYASGIVPEFYSMDFPKLIYSLNKNRMRLALEMIIQGDRTGEDYANEIFVKIEGLAKYGGKLEFLTLDGMMFRGFYIPEISDSPYRSIEEGIEAMAECTRVVKERYPWFEIIPLPNLPNWDVKDAEGNIVLHNAGQINKEIGLDAWNDLCDMYLAKLNEKGVSIKYIEIDHPYYYYDQLGIRVVNVNRVKAIKDYCDNNNLDLIVIVNQSNVGNGSSENKDALFKQGCMDYVDDLRNDGINPEYIDVESWYEFPHYLVPETKENSFTNVIRDVGDKFLFTGKIIVSSAGDVNKITGYGKTLQFNAKDVSSGETVDVDWSVDDESVATIDELGLLTTVYWGTVTVKALSKDGSGQYDSFTLTVIDADLPDEIVIRSEGEVSVIDPGDSLQFYAEDAANGNPAEVNWSVDNIRAAVIKENGMLTAVKLGSIYVVARLKANPDVVTSYPLLIKNTTSDKTILNNLKSVEIFPNPASGNFYVKIPEIPEVCTLRLVDITGKCYIRHEKVRSGLHSFSTRGMKAGLYFVHISSDTQVITQKLCIE